MKKEIIYYSGGSMGFPNSVELLENNKGKILEEGSELIVDLKEHKILHFWDRMNELQVWKWKKNYTNPVEMTDGYDWELKLRDRNGRAKYCTGYESYPNNYNEFIKELNNLFGSEIKDEKFEL
jgi:hypothetical protein